MGQRPRRSVQQEFLDEFPLPNTDAKGSGTHVARVELTKGQSLFEVSIQHLCDVSSLEPLATENTSNGPLLSRMLVELPNKFKNTLWIKRGGFVLVSLYNEPTTKVAGRIEHVLFDAQIKHIKQHNLWPSAFNDPN